MYAADIDLHAGALTQDVTGSIQSCHAWYYYGGWGLVGCALLHFRARATRLPPPHPPFVTLARATYSTPLAAFRFRRLPRLSSFVPSRTILRSVHTLLQYGVVNGSLGERFRHWERRPHGAGTGSHSWVPTPLGTHIPRYPVPSVPTSLGTYPKGLGT